MKRIVSLVLCLMMLLTSVALAEGMGVQVIGGPDIEVESVSLDDFKLNVPVTIDDYGELVGTSFAFVDFLGYYGKGNTRNWYTDVPNYKYESGKDADYAMLKMDITNLATTSRNFLAQCEVKVIFDDKYEYAGWFYQYNYNNDYNNQYKHNVNDVIDKSEIFAIDPMYAGHYCFGCTLPNAVIKSKAPLKMIITIDGNEITYNIRK